MPAVHDFSDYKAFLNEALSPTGESRGMRSKLATALGCNSGFISQVLKGNAHFSLEHAVVIAEFLKLSPEESEYFLLLVHLGKAGSVKLRRHYERQLKRILKSRNEIKNRITRSSSLKEEDLTTYYRNWMYAAVHMALSIPSYQKLPALMQKLGITRRQLEPILEFLLAKELIVFDGDRYQTGPTRIHLERSSPLISQHHTNWRVEAIHALSRSNNLHFHYSSVLTLSHADVLRVREALLRTLEEVEVILKPSPNEEIYSLGIDFFGLAKTEE